ncbi:MAG: hypothetical protein PHO92_03120 [Candidatus Peribacteraceae bacterium]|nr:hypothetical protein [Candidatus Peribacteraceae bacterium]
MEMLLRFQIIFGIIVGAFLALTLVPLNKPLYILNQEFKIIYRMNTSKNEGSYCYRAGEVLKQKRDTPSISALQSNAATAGTSINILGLGISGNFLSRKLCIDIEENPIIDERYAFRRIEITNIGKDFYPANEEKCIDINDIQIAKTITKLEIVPEHDFPCDESLSDPIINTKKGISKINISSKVPNATLYRILIFIGGFYAGCRLLKSSIEHLLTKRQQRSILEKL